MVSENSLLDANYEGKDILLECPGWVLNTKANWLSRQLSFLDVCAAGALTPKSYC